MFCKSFFEADRLRTDRRAKLRPDLGSIAIIRRGENQWVSRFVIA